MPASSLASDLDSDSSRLSDASSEPPPYPQPRLRGLRWRVLLGTLPPCPAPIQDLRRAAANGRRRYAELRRHLIVDPHAVEDRLSVDNPLSQDSDSVWGRYFRNAELERAIENDLSRLYPEDGSFFQSFACQAMLRRILLVWALSHPRYSYRQGMHEVLAPLLYVLHMDVIHLSQVRQRYEDPFENRFDAPIEEKFNYNKEGRQVATSFSAHTTLLASKEIPIMGDEDWLERVHPEDWALVEPDDFGFNLKTMVLGSDSYGAEGELGALLTGRFVEHDAYCMFDAVLSEQGGAVVLADYFSSVNEGGLATGLSPVLEASAAVYHTLAAVDMPLYIHLVGLGVEPQFFALRWLRVLFSREFGLDKLLLLWDAIFEAPNVAVVAEGSNDSSDAYKSSPRGSFISSFAASMLVHLRPTLLASSNATSCLQKLLNFPKNADVRIVIENAKALQLRTEENMITLTPPIANFAWIFEQSRGGKHGRGSWSPSFQNHIPATNKTLQHRHSCSPEMMRPLLPESYWEEKWKNSILPKVVAGEVYGVQNVEAGGNEMPNALVSSNIPMDHRGKQSNQSEHLKVSSNAHHMDGSEKFTSHKMLTDHVQGVASSVFPEDRKRDALASRSASVPGSPRRVEASCKQLHNGAGSEGTMYDTISSLPRPYEENRGSISRNASIEVCSNIVGNDSLRSDGAGICFCGGGEDKKVLGSCSAQGAGVATYINHKSSAQQSSGGECPRCLADRGNQDDSRKISGLQQNGREINKCADLPATCPHEAIRPELRRRLNEKIGSDVNSIENQGSSDSDSNKGLRTVKIAKECGLTNALETLGRSMVENIQVLECALTHRSSVGKDGVSAASREKTELFPKNFLNGKGHVTALLALAKLRKISNILLQM